MEVEMKIRRLMMDPVTNMPIVILKDVNGSTVLPIWVGVYEANAIALEIEKVATPRPMTHDLIKTLLLGLDTNVRKVVVSELKDDTFYAAIANGLSLGSSGLMTETGMAYLVSREDRPFLAGHGGGETAATPEQVETVRRFSADLKTVLEDAPGS